MKTIIEKPICLIRNFNIEVTTKSCKYKRYLAWFAKFNYINKIFIFYLFSIN